MKFSEMNDLDLRRWKEYDHITTKTMWITKGANHFEVSSKRPENKAFHGIFIPEIPYQMILKYTKEGDYIWDCFAGSGTTIDVGRSLGREVIANDIKSLRPEIIEADSETFNPGRDVQMVIMHPPYFNIIKFSNLSEDLSNLQTIDEFFRKFERIVKNVTQYLDESRILILVLGEIYCNSEEVPLGFYGMQIIRKYGFKLKSWIVKDYGVTKKSLLFNRGLERYRALRGGYFNFSFDNIFVLQKGRNK